MHIDEFLALVYTRLNDKHKDLNNLLLNIPYATEAGVPDVLAPEKIRSQMHGIRMAHDILKESYNAKFTIKTEEGVTNGDISGAKY